MPNGTDPPESSTGDGQAEPIPTQGPQAPYETVFGRLAHIVMQQPRRAWAAVLLMTLASLLLATRITVDPNLLRLLPPDDPTTRALQELDQQEGGANLLTIAVEGKDGDTLDAYMSELQESLQELPEVEYAIYDLEPELAWRIGLMQLSPEDLSQIRQSLSGAISMGSAVTNPFVASRILDLGPLTSKLRMAGQHDALASSEGTARVLVRPTGSAHDPEFARRFMDTVYDLLASLDAPSRGLRVAWVGGAYRHSVEDLEGMLYDLRWTVVVSLTLVFLFVGFAFRDPRAVLLIFTPLLFGNLWTLGYAALSVGTLTTFTSFFSAVLIGLGVDFSIHLHARYREERAQGDSLRAAVIRAWDRVGPPCATAAITSAGGFCALWAAGFQGFQQLGTLLAGGVLLCLLAVLTVLPLLILWREKQPHAIPLRPVRRPRVRRPPTYRLAPLGLLLTFLVTLAAAMMLPRVGFQYDISEMRSKGLAYADLDSSEQQLAEDSYAPIIVAYPDSESLAADHQRLTEAVEDGRFAEAGRILSIYSMIPTEQPRRVALLEEIAELARHENVIYLPLQVQKNLEHIASSDLAALVPDDLPRSLRHALGSGGEHHRILLIPAGNMWDLRETARLHDALDTWIPDRPVAGEYLAMSVLYRLVQGDAPRVAGLAIFLVLLLSWADLRSPRRALGAVSALVVGMCWAGAAMAVFRVNLSLVNFVGIPILVGIGVDVIIHLLHRMSEEGPGHILRALQTTGWAAALSTATTVLSFASLSVASSQGIRSLGILIVLGLTTVTVAAFVAVPLGWMTTWKIRGQLPQDLIED